MNLQICSNQQFFSPLLVFLLWAPNWAFFERYWALFCSNHLVTLIANQILSQCTNGFANKKLAALIQCTNLGPLSPTLLMPYIKSSLEQELHSQPGSDWNIVNLNLSFQEARTNLYEFIRILIFRIWNAKFDCRIRFP